jgi:predicted AlkP superfamily pyrophosphatase or phosphodiesterase
MKTLIAAVLLASAAAAPIAAQDAPAPVPAAATPAPRTPPKLIVAISVDQFSADLFQQYRNRFTGGFARLLNGAVFPAGYQSHAATETCPGHSTILTGMRPAHTGIIANSWVDLKTPRADKTVYCAEDESVPGSTSEHYTVSDKHLKVPTLGERMKNANPKTRVVSVAGKDRAAVMMGGHKVDELWWYENGAFVSYAGRVAPPAVKRTNAAVQALVARPQAALDVPAFCRATDHAVLANGRSVGTGRFVRAAGDEHGFRASPAFDASIGALGVALVQDMKLGKGPATDIIDIGLSATDYVGHGYGTEGLEMCLQLANLDETLGGMFDALDATGVDYEVVLTADHGGNDTPEREREHGMPMAARVDRALAAATVGKSVAGQLGLSGQLLWGDGGNGDVWIDPAITAKQRAAVIAAATRIYTANPQVAAVFTREAIAATPMPSGPPETWTLIERARASFNPDHSGDLIVFLRPRITAIPEGSKGNVATHGSPWDYDRRVPILFWRRGMTGFEQPLSVETVDIAPTLAATINLPVSGLDGRCLDLDPGAASTCAN